MVRFRTPATRLAAAIPVAMMPTAIMAGILVIPTMATIPGTVIGGGIDVDASATAVIATAIATTGITAAVTATVIRDATRQ